LTQEELAARIKTQKTAISRIENHSEDIKLSTLGRVAHALGKKLQVHIA
jgi:transcriptional regulator with XRE-family HTH domain